MICQYNQLVPVLFGAGAVTLLGEKVSELGCKKVLCVYDRGIKAAGLSVKAEQSLKAANVEFIVFDKIVADPPSELIDEGGKLAKESGVDCVVGIGGGSSMDAAKAIALLLDHEPPVAQYLKLPPLELKSSVPIVLIPTTAGTGSEVTQISILLHTKINAKLSVFLRSTLAIVDPELTLSVPPAVTAFTGLDALSHAVEAITAKKWNPRSEVLALSAIQKIAAYLPVAYQDGNNVEARTNLCLASNWAGIAFADTDVHFGHSIADGISAAFHTPHGINCAWVTPQTIELVTAAMPGKVKLIGEAMGVSFTGNESSEAIGAKTAQSIRDLMKTVQIMSMSEMGFPRDRVVSCAKVAMESGLRFNCPVAVTREMTEDMLGKIYDNYK
jgi:1,3-propanediol dehydrogenase